MIRNSSDSDLDDLLNLGYRYALSLCHERAQAEDLVQDALTRLLDRKASLERSYFLTTIRNRFIDGYRRERRVLFMSLEHDNDNGDESNAPDVPSDERWTLPDILAADQLHDALAELRPEERETLFLSVVEEYTAQEISDMTARPRGSILSSLFRTKKKLKAALEARKVFNHEAGQA